MTDLYPNWPTGDDAGDALDLMPDWLLLHMPKLYSQDGEGQDATVFVKWFGGACTWLITEYDPATRIAFGWCDLGLGFPELGYVSLDEVQSLTIPPIGARIERDLYFVPRPLRNAMKEEVR
jgi:Protein of unknown function (DUF2958)